MTELEAFDLLEQRGLVQFGTTGSVPHAAAGENRLGRPDAVIIDTFDVTGGYHSDITRPVFIGEPEEEMRRVYDVVRRAQDAALAAAGPGVPACNVDRAARAVIEEAGYGPNFTHRTGHGLGLEIHEPPWLRDSSDAPLLPGDVITIEPGIYLPGRWGVRIEDDVLITGEGCELLSEREEGMTIVDA
jgi:Xaa-Pro aminopeptidase